MAPDGTAPRVHLLVLADAMWVKWGPEISEPDGRRPWQRHRDLLRRLLTDADGGWDGSILHEPELGELMPLLLRATSDDVGSVRELHGLLGLDLADPHAATSARPPLRSWAAATARKRAEIRTAYGDGTGARAPRGRRWTPGWHTDPDAVAGLVGRLGEGLEHCNRILDSGAISNDPLVGAMLNLHSCRVHLRPDQLSRLWRSHSTTAPDDPFAYPHASLDLRFRSHHRTFWLYAVLSLWTSEPASPAHSPTPRRPGAAPPRPLDVPRRRDQLLAFRDLFAAQLDTDFWALSPTVLNRPYRPPRFWTVDGDGLFGPDARDGQAAWRDEIGRTLLGAPVSSSAVDAGEVVRRDDPALEVVRRFAGSPVSAPSYLVIPGPGPAVAQENAVRLLVQRLNRDEARAAAELYDLTARLDRNRVLVYSYDWVQRRLSVLWDELSMHFPTARGARLTVLHSLADLVHQILLQSIADLQNVVMEIQNVDREIAALTARSTERFDDAGFVERPTGDGRPIRDAISRGGYISLADRIADETRESAVQSRDSYAAMLDGIAHAFDERRVRVTDRVATYGLLLALPLALFGFATGLWTEWLTEIHRDATAPDPAVFWGLIGTGVGLVLLLVVLFGIVHQVQGTLKTTREFRARYRSLKAYLLSCRTENLVTTDETWRREALARAGPDRWTGYFASWDEVDATLAERYAEQLDAIAGFGRRRSAGPAARVRALLTPRATATRELNRVRGMRDLRADVERWALTALLVNERPRAFHRFPLPRLTLLYRYFSLGELGGGHREAPIMVADSDLRTCLREHLHAGDGQLDRIRAFGLTCRDEGRHLDHDAAARTLDTIRAGLGLEPEGPLRIGLPHAAARTVLDERLAALNRAR